MAADQTPRTPAEWLPVAADIAEDANTRLTEAAANERYRRTGDSADWEANRRRMADLAVRIGPGATEGIAPAYYREDRREVVIDSAIAMPGTDPAAARWQSRRWRRNHLRAVGLAEHELGHAIHSDTRKFRAHHEQSAAVGSFSRVMEETRMEAALIREGGDRRALSAVAHELILRDFREDQSQGRAADALNAALILGRDERHGGCLRTADVDRFRAVYAERHGEGFVRAVDSFLNEWNRTPDEQVPDGPGMEALRERWIAGVGSDPEPEQGEQSGGDQSGEQGGESQGQGQGGGEQSGEQSQGGGGDQPNADQSQGEQSGDPGTDPIRDLIAEQAESSAEQLAAAAAAEDRAEAEADQKVTEQITHGHAMSGRREVQIADVPIDAAANRLRAELTRHLSALALPEVVRTHVSQELPPGRLRGRGAALRSAQRSAGMIPTAEPFRSTRKRITKAPPPVIGVMMDCSGSMQRAERSVGLIGWALAEAGRAVQAKTALVAFMDQAVLVEHSPGTIRTPLARGGWENFQSGFQILNRRLHLSDPARGARVLFIVTDGGFRERESVAAIAATRTLERRGVAVVWAAVGTYWAGNTRGLNDAGTVVQIPDTSDPARVARELIAQVDRAMLAARVSA